MKFRFRLQSVMNHRERLKKQAEEAYQLALADMNNEKSKLNGLYEKVRETRQAQLSGVSQGSATGGGLASQSEFIAGVAIQIERQKDVVREHLAIVEEKMLEYQMRARDFEAMVKLRDKKQEQFRKELKKREQKQSDELAVLRGRKGVAS